MQVKRNVMINKAGGNAGKNSVNYRLSIPADMIHGLGITRDNRSVILNYDEGKIIIEKSPEP